MFITSGNSGILLVNAHVARYQHQGIVNFFMLFDLRLIPESGDSRIFCYFSMKKLFHIFSNSLVTLADKCPRYLRTMQFRAVVFESLQRSLRKKLPSFPLHLDIGSVSGCPETPTQLLIASVIKVDSSRYCLSYGISVRDFYDRS